MKEGYMRKILSIITLCMLLFTAGCAKQNPVTSDLDRIIKNDKIVVGVKYDTKPFGYIDENDQLQGFDVDLAKKIAKYILGDENKVEYKEVTTSSRLRAVNSGEVDMVIATMTITPLRAGIVDFSKPYYVAGQTVMVSEKSDIKSISDLKNKKVIIVFGSTAEQNLKLVAPDAKIVGFKTYTSAYNALKQGAADAMAADDTILLGFVSYDKDMRILPKRYTKEPYAIGFKKGIVSETLRSKVDFILNEMYKNGELKNLKSKWIKY